jgi:hypothetical protein
MPGRSPCVETTSENVKSSFLDIHEPTESEMKARHVISVVALAAAATSLPGFAQTTAGAGTVMVLPLASNIPGAYSTTVFVRNPSSNPQITLKVRYYQSNSGNPAGNGTPYTCSNLVIPSNQVVTFDLASQCTFPGPGVNNFGQIVLEDITSIPDVKTHPFFAYSRTEATTGNGFSVEGFPVGNFSSSTADAVGLKQTPSTAPHYKSNCFVGALGEQVDYQVLLYNGAGGLISTNTISGTLQPYQSVRILDVFTAAGVAGNQSNVRATFTNTNAAGTAMIGFCTLETTDNGSADFRVAKSSRANDVRQSRLICYAMDNCTDTTASITNPAQLAAGKRNIHWAIFDQPDFVQCQLVSDQLAALQIQLRSWSDSVQGTTPFTLPAGYNTAPYTAGGAGATSFYVYTGEKSTVNNGETARWFIDVTASGAGSPTFPINYGIKCTSGNGISVPWLGRSV